MLWTKRAHKRLLCVLVKVHPTAHVSFETTRSRFTQILHHFLVSWKISPLYFFSSKLCTLDKKQFSDFWMVGWKFTKFLMSCLKLQNSFSLHDSSVSWEITLLLSFSWKCTWFGQREPVIVQNFRLSTAHLKFEQICTWMGSFC